MKKLLTIAMVATIMIVPSMVGITYAGLICPPNITSSVVSDVTVDGLCVIGDSADDTVTGNVKLDADDDQVNFNAGTIYGNIKCTDSSTSAVYSVAVGTDTTMYGDVKATGCDPVIFGTTIMTGNVKVVNGDLTILGGATINGDVKHYGSGTCTIVGGATITGSITGC